jgi:Flp pilus assembly protein TadB
MGESEPIKAEMQIDAGVRDDAKVGVNGQGAFAGLARKTKRLMIGVIGLTVVLVGGALLVLPGPGLVTIFAGVAILATEFVWARRLLRQGKRAAKRSRLVFLVKARSFWRTFRKRSKKR